MHPHVSKRAKWTAGVAALIAAAAAGLFLSHRAIDSYVARQIRQSAGENVRIGQLQVRLFPSIRIVAQNIVVPQRESGGLPPLISLEKAVVETNWIAALARHVETVQLAGLRIAVPPRGDAALHGGSKKTPSFSIGRLIADGSTLDVYPKQAGKAPLHLDLYRLTLHGAGPDQPMSFQATLRNPRPPGEIHSSGTFGPWQFDQPAATPVSGRYTFRNANLGVFKGISGTLASDGTYHGVLDRIEVDGATATPDFALRISGRPLNLTTKFHATVNGADGETTLDAVEAHLEQTTIVARGAITSPGRTVSLDATVNGGRLADLLHLALKSKAVMNGAVSFQSRIVIPAGDDDVVDKLQLDGAFTVGEAHFQKLNVQEKVNELSHRGSGDPQESSADNVASNFRGRFRLKNGVMTFTGLRFDVPGVRIALDGTYGLVSEQLNLNGTARMDAKPSQMTTGWKSILLKVVDPLFSKKNAGTDLPIHIGGTSRSPKFELRITP